MTPPALKNLNNKFKNIPGKINFQIQDEEERVVHTFAVFSNHLNLYKHNPLGEIKLIDF